MFRIYQGVNSYSEGQYTCSAVLASGSAVQLESATGDTLVAATGTPLGFLGKSVTSDGPSDFEREHLVGVDAFEVITGSVVPVIGFANGIILTDVVAAGISGATISDALLTLKSGLWDKSASGDTVCGKLLATDAEGVSGLYKIQLLTGGVREGV